MDYDAIATSWGWLKLKRGWYHARAEQYPGFVGYPVCYATSKELCKMENLTATQPCRPEGDGLQDRVMDALRAAFLHRNKGTNLITTKWKDGIDIDEPSYDAMAFARALLATQPARDAAEGAVPLADHDEIGRKVLQQPWDIQKAIVTIASHCVVLKDEHAAGPVADIAGCISHNCMELADALAVPPNPAPDAMRSLGAETIQTLLDLLNPLHGELDRQTYDAKVAMDFDMPADYSHDDISITAQMERDLTQAVLILEDRKRSAPVPPADGALTDEQIASCAGAAEPVAWPDHPGATVDAVALVEGVKRYPNVDRDAPDLAHADRQAACQGAFINGFKRAMEMRAPAVRGDRETIAMLLDKTAKEKSNVYLSSVCTFAMADVILSFPVQPGAGEREALLRYLDIFLHPNPKVDLSGFVCKHGLAIEACAARECSNPMAYETAISRARDYISRQAPHSSSEGGR